MLFDIFNNISRSLGIDIKLLKKKEHQLKNRDYQFNYIEFNFKKNDKVLDIGSGCYPFKYGTHQVDLYYDNNFHRGGEAIKRDNRPLVISNIETLPFKDKQFDFAYCSHVLEHVACPVKACNEIMRVAKRGYIETPTRTSDIMLNYTYIHTWHISMLGNSLIFVPYSAREKKGTGVNSFETDLQSSYMNEFSRLVYANRDLFCNMLLWKDTFNYYVFDQEGKLCDSSARHSMQYEG